MFGFAVALVLWAWPSFGLLHVGIRPTELTILQTILTVIMTGFGAASAVTMAEQFPAEVRVTGIAVPYTSSVTLCGGTAPYLMAAMAGWGYGHLFWIYLTVISAISAVVYLRMPETKDLPLR